MARNLYNPKKFLLDHTLELLPKTCSKTSVAESSEPENGAKSNTVDSFGKANNYFTWPSLKLRTTIEEAVYKLISRDHSKQVLSIIDEVEHELNSTFPVEIGEQLDFCMMCPQIDHIEAVELQIRLCTEYELVGKVLWECVPLGRDVFSVIEDMLNNSTKLLYYVTERFDESDACAYIAKTLLIEQDNEDSERKVIPLVTDFDIPVPETFELVDKLYLCNKLQFQYRFRAVFSRDVKQEKNIRTEKLKRRLDDERKFTIWNMVQNKIGK